MISDDIKRLAQIELAKRDFFEYCHLKAPDFYSYDRRFLIDLADSLQSFYYSDDDVLVVNVPPRHGKSRTAQCFAEWLFGKHPQTKIMTGSYNETLSTVFAKGVRNHISEKKASPEIVVYSDIFPETKIKDGDGAMSLWALQGRYASYLATSPTGTATGFGASIIMIDDLIKNAKEAFNATTLEAHWSWFTDTMLSRLESGGKVIIIMTRWHSDDLAGKALEVLPGMGYKLKHVNFKAMQDDGTMLCDEILTRKEFDLKTSAMAKEIAYANYQQEPIDIKGRLYGEFKVYGKRAKDYSRVVSYVDTADEGSDYLSMFIAGERFDGELEILDAIYTTDSMDITEELVAKKLHEHRVNICWIESNSGGRGFARSVERILHEEIRWRGCVIEPFHQSKNKIARILSNATYVMKNIYFPDNWANKWPDLYKALARYQKEGKNAHDDAPDALTGLCEMTMDGDGFSFD